MLNQLVELCTSDTGLTWLLLASDAAIVVAYFAIPIVMAVVLRDRRDDIPYPWLWVLFVTFIVACGLTHLAHVWTAATGIAYLQWHVVIGIVTALASLGTAVAFAFILPQIKMLPSPRQQQAQLEQMVAERSREKDRLIREINHRIGNQIQVLSSIVSIETRRADGEEAHAILGRLRAQLDKMGEEHIRLSRHDYLLDGTTEGSAPDAGGAAPR